MLLLTIKFLSHRLLLSMNIVLAGTELCFCCVCSGGSSEIHGWRWEEILEKTEVDSVYLP